MLHYLSRIPRSLLLVGALSGLLCLPGCPSDPADIQLAEEGLLDAGGDVSMRDTNESDTESDTTEDVESSDACTPKSDEELCGDLECGILDLEDGVDNCGVEREVRCGNCDLPEQCHVEEQNKCGCIPQPKEELCSELNAECGEFDNGCGDMIECGQPCDGEGESCVHDEDEYVCDDDCTPIESCSEVEGVECGRISDGCGGEVICEQSCADDHACTSDNQCVCVPQDSDSFCEDQGAECQYATGDDNCGERRTVFCDRCPEGQTCTQLVIGLGCG